MRTKRINPLIQAFLDCSVRTKLRLLTAAAVALALSAACIAFVIKDAQTLRTTKAMQLSALAEVVGANTTAALEFHDPANAEGLLASQRAHTPTPYWWHVTPTSPEASVTSTRMECPDPPSPAMCHAQAKNR